MADAAPQWVVALAGAWLVGVGLLMAVSPRRALAGLAALGGSSLIHFGEMGLRIVVGAALILAAPTSRFPTEIAVIGWFLVVSAVVLIVLPRSWHAAYSRWWSERIPVAAVRLVAPLSIAGGFVLVWCVA